MPLLAVLPSLTFHLENLQNWLKQDKLVWDGLVFLFWNIIFFSPWCKKDQVHHEFIYWMDKNYIKYNGGPQQFRNHQLKIKHITTILIRPFFVSRPALKAYIKYLGLNGDILLWPVTASLRYAPSPKRSPHKELSPHRVYC